MKRITLIAASDRKNLSTELLEPLRSAWGGSAPIWLSKQEAVYFLIRDTPKNFWTVWKDLQQHSIDMVCQEDGHQKKAVLLADMDSTMIEQECIDEIAARAGFGPQVSKITAQAMNGELDFNAALKARVQLLSGLAQTVISDVITHNITYTPGGKVLLATMKANGAYSALVSGGFTAFTHVVAKKLGFNEHHANTLICENGVLTGDVLEPILGRDAKVDALKNIASKQGLTPFDVLAVGDGSNDLGMLDLAGSGVALHAKPALQDLCDLRINHADLTALLYLQGYAKSDFVDS